MSGHSHTSVSPALRAMGHTGVAAGIVAFSCGVILLYRLTLLPPYPWLIGLSLAALGLAYRRGRCSGFVVLLAWALCGMAWASWQAGHRLQEQLPAGLEGQPLEVSGYVCNLPEPGSFDSLRFNFCVLEWHAAADAMPESRLPETLRLAWYGREGKTLPGQRLRLQVVLKRPHGNLNSAGFRYEDWLFRHGFRATGSVRAVKADPSLGCGLTCLYHSWHQKVAAGVGAQFGSAERFPLIASLLIGYRGYLGQAHWETLKATGTIHLVAISGLHLGLVAVAAGLLARWILMLVPARCLSARRSRVAVFSVVVLCSAFYALLAGFTVPTRRALVMVVVGGSYLLLARQTSAWRPFLLALGLVLVFDPFAPLDQGFWLSFTAVGVLLLVFAGRVSSPGWLKGLVIAQFAVFAGLWPVLSQFDQTQPVAGVLANLVAIPWLSLVVMPVLFAAAAATAVSGGALAAWVVPLMDAPLSLLWQWLEWVQALPVNTMQTFALPSNAGWLTGLLALMTVLALRAPVPGFRAMVVAVVVAWLGAATLARQPVNPEPGISEVRVLDVGQGLSVLVRSGRQVLLYDTGPAVDGVFSSVESVLLPGLRALGVRQLDYLVVSHGDNDHAGGLPLVLGALDVGKIISGEPGVIAGRIADVAPVESCRSMSVNLGDLRLDFWRSEQPKNGNDASCVVRIVQEKSDTEILLTGDISKAVEAEMLADPSAGWVSRKSAHRVILAPHHGSKTSSSARFLDAVQPDQVIYTAGYRHRFGHPHPDVTARYRSLGARALNTACSGQLVISLHDNGPEIREMRHTAPFWIAGAGQARDQCKIP